MFVQSLKFRVFDRKQFECRNIVLNEGVVNGSLTCVRFRLNWDLFREDRIDFYIFLKEDGEGLRFELLTEGLSNSSIYRDIKAKNLKVENLVGKTRISCNKPIYTLIMLDWLKLNLQTWLGAFSILKFFN